MTEMDKIRADLIEWSKNNNPEKEEKQNPYDLWCSMNRLICDHFGTDWMKNSKQTYVNSQVMVYGQTNKTEL